MLKRRIEKRIINEAVCNHNGRGYEAHIWSFLIDILDRVAEGVRWHNFSYSRTSAEIGLGSSRTAHILCVLIHTQTPIVVFGML